MIRTNIMILGYYLINLYLIIYKNMALQIFILLAGLLLILFGANWLVDGSSSIAKRFGISEFVIGLTIVGIGTSSPEMVVSFMSSFQGKADMAIGNIVGSNIFNTLMILDKEPCRPLRECRSHRCHPSYTRCRRDQG